MDPFYFLFKFFHAFYKDNRKDEDLDDFDSSSNYNNSVTTHGENEHD